MKKDLSNRSDFYQTHFGMVPAFKAGMHFGEVTTGEIGALRKEIFFTGDVLNATARIQGMCNEHNSELLISGELANELKVEGFFTIKSLGHVVLKGRSEPMEIYEVAEKVPTPLRYQKSILPSV